GIPVHGQVEDRVVAIEEVLGAVAVMDVEVDDEDSLPGGAPLQVPRGPRDLVEEPEPHGALARGVVSGRADGAERVPRAPGRDLIDGREQRADREPGDLDRPRRARL